MKILNKEGLRILPCLTPLRTDKVIERDIFHLSTISRLLYHIFNIATKHFECVFKCNWVRQKNVNNVSLETSTFLELRCWKRDWQTQIVQLRALRNFHVLTIVGREYFHATVGATLETLVGMFVVPCRSVKLPFTYFLTGLEPSAVS